MRWTPYRYGELFTAPRRLVLVQIDRDEKTGYPPSVAVGYLKYAAGEMTSPMWVVSGFGRPFDVTHWAPLPRSFAAPLWNDGKPWVTHAKRRGRRYRIKGCTNGEMRCNGCGAIVEILRAAKHLGVCTADPPTCVGTLI